MTALDVFREIAVRRGVDLQDDELTTLRNLVDAQADLLLDAFLRDLDANQNKYEYDDDPGDRAADDVHRERSDQHLETDDRREP